MSDDLIQRLRDPATAASWADADKQRWEAADRLEAQDAEIARLKEEARAFKGFADLWYYVMDEKPREFERIVAEFAPNRWMTEAHKLYRASREA